MNHPFYNSSSKSYRGMTLADIAKGSKPNRVARDGFCYPKISIKCVATGKILTGNKSELRDQLNTHYRGLQRLVERGLYLVVGVDGIELPPSEQRSLLFKDWVSFHKGQI